VSAEPLRTAIDRIVADAEAAFDGRRWPWHPLDDAEDATCGLYLGAAGIVWALHELGREGWADAALLQLDRYRAEPDGGEHASAGSYWVGECGIALAAWRLTGDAALADRVEELVRGNLGSPANEVMLGAPGSLLAAEAMRAWTGEERWDALWHEGAERVLAARDEDGLWTQQLFGRATRCLGPAHGFAGIVRALRNGDVEVDRVDEVLRRFALPDGNWPPSPDSPSEQLRVQWCHGAPGIVASLGDRLDLDLALAGGEATWRAGPHPKGPSLCHGTAGNGYAFLVLHRRTGDSLWLERARSFAMHAIDQVETARAELGRGRYSLFTGDLGVALYLRDVLAAHHRFPTLGPFA
jgi:hypothetical protein